MMKPLVDGFFHHENRLDQRLHVLVSPWGVDVSGSALRFPTRQLRRHRRAIGSRWRRLTIGRRALLTLAHLRVGHTGARLAAGFDVGTTTTYRWTSRSKVLVSGRRR